MTPGAASISRFFIVVCAVAGLACSGLPDALRGGPDAPPALPTVPAPPSAPLPPMAPAHVVSHAEAVAAYEADCHHRFAAPETADFDVTGDDLEECAFVDFDQNCSPDPSGCWDRGQACVGDCSTVCTGCQTTCAGTCDDCKAACQGNPSCVHACAESRATCRETCVSAKATCTGNICPGTESACYAAFEKTRAEKCPDCEGLRACVEAGWSNGTDSRAECPPKFPNNPPECLEWCAPEM